MASAPRYVLSERAATALRGLIAPGSAYGARKRPAHDPGATPAPALLAVRAVRQWQAPAPGEDEGEVVERLQIYLGPSGAPAATAIRINGRAAPIDAANTPADGWLDLGLAESVQAVWLLPYIATPSAPADYYGAANFPSPAQVRYEIAARGTPTQPPQTTHAAPATGTALYPRYLRPVLVWSPDGQVQWGGATLSAEVADADGTHDGVHEGFCSVQQLEGGRLQLYGFAAPTWLGAEDLDTGDGGLLVRQGPTPQSGGPARLVYVAWQALRDYFTLHYGFDLLSWLSDPNNLAELIGILGPAEDAAGLWWPRGGDESVCYGSAIGDAAGRTKVIDLNGKILVGPWKTDDDFAVGDNANAADLTVNGDAAVTGDLVVNGDAGVVGNVSATGSLDVTGAGKFGGPLDMTGHDLTAVQTLQVADVDASSNVQAAGKVLAGGNIETAVNLVGAGLEIAGDTYAPQQITYIDAAQQSHTITVLVKQ